MNRRFDLVAYLKLFRFPLVFTAIADSMAGYLIFTSSDTVKASVLAMLAACSSGLYFFGMAMNDIADLARDRTLAPGRVLPSGRLTLLQAKGAAGTVLLVSLVFVIFGSDTPLIQRLLIWSLVVLAILSYDFFLKVPPVMGVVRMGNFMLGLFSAIPFHWVPSSGYPVWAAFLIALPQLVYVSALTYVSTLEEGDIDRRRLAVGAGCMIAATMLASVWFPLLQNEAHIPLQYADESLKYPLLGRVAAGTLCAWLAFRAWKARDRKGVMLLVRDGIGGIILLDAAVLSSAGSEYWKGVVGVLALVIPSVLSVAIFKKLA